MRSLRLNDIRHPRCRKAGPARRSLSRGRRAKTCTSAGRLTGGRLPMSTQVCTVDVAQISYNGGRARTRWDERHSNCESSVAAEHIHSASNTSQSHNPDLGHPDSRPNKGCWYPSPHKYRQYTVLHRTDIHSSHRRLAQPTRPRGKGRSDIVPRGGCPRIPDPGDIRRLVPSNRPTLVHKSSRTAVWSRTWCKKVGASPCTAQKTLCLLCVCSRGRLGQRKVPWCLWASTPFLGTGAPTTTWRNYN